MTGDWLKKTFACFLLLYPSVIACGYQTANSRPVHGIRKLRVMQAVNETPVPAIGHMLTSELRRCINSSSRPELAASSDQSSPALMVKVIYTKEDISSVRIQRSGSLAPGDHEIEILVKAVIKREDGTDIWGPSEFRNRVNYVDKALPLDSSTARQRAVSEAAGDLARKICSSVTGI